MLCDSVHELFGARLSFILLNCPTTRLSCFAPRSECQRTWCLPPLFIHAREPRALVVTLCDPLCAASSARLAGQDSSVLWPVLRRIICRPAVCPLRSRSWSCWAVPTLRGSAPRPTLGSVSLGCSASLPARLTLILSRSNCLLFFVWNSSSDCLSIVYRGGLLPRRARDGCPCVALPAVERRDSRWNCLAGSAAGVGCWLNSSGRLFVGRSTRSACDIGVTSSSP